MYLPQQHHQNKIQTNSTRTTNISSNNNISNPISNNKNRNKKDIKEPEPN